MSVTQSRPGSRFQEFEGAIEAPVGIEEFFDFAMTHGWGDGLPLVPPTAGRVDAFLGANPQYDPDEDLGTVAPRHGVATIRQIAVNAIMAGCRPEYLPVIVTGVRAMLYEQFGLESVQTTTHTVAPLLVMHGPIVEELGANAGTGAFGPGNRANATIGRAIRLVLWNIGGGHPGVADQCAQGAPSKYTYCIAENRDASPWPSLAERRGIDPARSAVTMFPVTVPENVNDHVHGNPVGVLTTMASCIATLGTNNMYANWGEVVCVFSPTHARIIASAGWDTNDVSHYLYEHARLPLGTVKQGGMAGMGGGINWTGCETDDDKLMPVTVDPSDFVVFVAGGEGHHSSVLKNFATPRSVTLPLDPQR